jgi:hypothetical protein
VAVAVAGDVFDAADVAGDVLNTVDVAGDVLNTVDVAAAAPSAPPLDAPSCCSPRSSEALAPSTPTETAT